MKNEKIKKIVDHLSFLNIIITGFWVVTAPFVFFCYEIKGIDAIKLLNCIALITWIILPIIKNKLNKKIEENEQ